MDVCDLGWVELRVLVLLFASSLSRVRLYLLHLYN